MKRLAMVVLVALAAACGGSSGDGPDGPPCYTYTLDPGNETYATNCTDEGFFCWWTGRDSFGDPTEYCLSHQAVLGCLNTVTGQEDFSCQGVVCGATIVINDAECCEHRGCVN